MPRAGHACYPFDGPGGTSGHVAAGLLEDAGDLPQPRGDFRAGQVGGLLVATAAAGQAEHPPGGQIRQLIGCGQAELHLTVRSDPPVGSAFGMHRRPGDGIAVPGVDGFDAAAG